MKSGHDTLFSICNTSACSQKGIFFPGGVKGHQNFIRCLFSHALGLHFSNVLSTWVAYLNPLVKVIDSPFPVLNHILDDGPEKAWRNTTDCPPNAIILKNPLVCISKVMELFSHVERVTVGLTSV